jgi:hypothetical protein
VALTAPLPSIDGAENVKSFNSTISLCAYFPSDMTTFLFARLLFRRSLQIKNECYTHVRKATHKFMFDAGDFRLSLFSAVLIHNQTSLYRVINGNFHVSNKNVLRSVKKFVE